MNFLNRFKYARDSYLITIMIVLIALMVNFIAARHFIKADLTKNQLYALSGASKNIVRDLDDIVTVKVFFSDTLPPNLYAVRQYVQDILSELSSFSKGNLNVQFPDTDNNDVKKDAQSLGIPQIQMNIVDKDKLEVKNGYLGIAVTYNNKTEILPVVQNIMNVEYDLVAAIKKVTSKQEKVVGYLEGHGEPVLADQMKVGQQGDSYSYLRQSLEKNYTVKEVNLKDGGKLDGIDTLIIAGSRQSFSDDEKFAIDQFIMNGGNLILMVDKIDVSQDLKTSSVDLGLDDMLANYGISFESKLLLDKSNENASFNQGYVNFIIPYPFWVKALNKFADKSNPVVASLDSVVFPWISPVSITAKEGIKTTALMSTTPESWAVGEPYNLAPDATQNLNSKSQYPLVSLAEGKFKSFFKDKENQLTESKKASRILIIGNSRFITDRFLANFGQNMPFAMNAIDYLTLDDSLIGIRSKTSFDLPLKDLSVGERQTVKVIGIFLMPVLVVAYGVFRFFARKRKKVTL